MAMVSLDAILPHVLAETPAAPPPLVIQTAAQVVAEFCRMTNTWTTTQTIVPLLATAAYALVAPDAAARVARILSASLGASALEPVSFAELERYDREWASKSGTTGAVLLAATGALTVYPKPDAAMIAAGKTFSVVVAWEPLHTAVTIDEFLLARHIHGFAVGVKARLFSMQNQPWSGPDPLPLRTEWSRYMRAARIADTLGYARRDVKLSGPRFA